MLFFKQSTASQAVVLGPFVDSTDGVTAETGLSIANTDIRLSKNGGNMAAKNSGGGTHDEAGWYTATFDATDTDTVGRLQISVAVSGALPVFMECQVLEEAVYDAYFASSAGGYVANAPVDVVQISGDATAADNLEAMYDGTGYTDETAPASRSQVGGLSSGTGSGFNYAVSADNTAGAIIDSVTFVGTQTGTFANTETNIATFHQIDHATNAVDLVYRVAAQDTEVFVGLVIDAYLNSSNDTLSIQLYDHIGADWEAQYTLAGTNGSAVTEITISPQQKHTGVIGTSEAGNMYVRFVTSAMTSPVLYIARVIGEAVQATSTMGYEGGSVYVDEVGGTSSGTTQGVDGIFANQCDDFDNGQTIADNLGTATITIHPGNSVTLSAALQGYTINNVQATLNGGSQNVDSTRINGGFLAGTFARAGTGVPTFATCNLNNVTSDRVACLANCGILGTFTISEAGVYVFNDAQAAGATSISTIDFASLAATVSMQRWSGSLVINNLASGATLNLHCVSGDDITLNGADATVNISGVYGAITNNLTGSPTVTDNGISLVNINAEADTAISDAGVSTHAAADVWSVTTRVLTAGTNLNDPTTAEIADAVLDEAYEGTTTLRQHLRLAAAALWGKASGLGTTTVTFRNEADDGDRIVATVDADGNRTAVTTTKT